MRAALIVAAGSGSRFGGDVPKQYAKLDGKPVLRHTLEALRQHGGVDVFCIVINPDWYQEAAAAAEGIPNVHFATGGASRQISVRNGLAVLAPFKPDDVLIHDAVRPFVTDTLMQRIDGALTQHPAVVPLVPLTDTVKTIETGMVTSTVPRETLFAAQTPQAFHFEPIIQAHEAFAHLDLTDDSALAEVAGIPVRAIEGEALNFKITHAQDLVRAEAVLEEKERKERLAKLQAAQQMAQNTSKSR